MLLHVAAACRFPSALEMRSFKPLALRGVTIRFCFEDFGPVVRRLDFGILFRADFGPATRLYVELKGELDRLLRLLDIIADNFISSEFSESLSESDVRDCRKDCLLIGIFLLIFGGR